MPPFRHPSNCALLGSCLVLVQLCCQLPSSGHGDAHEALNRLTEAMVASPQDAALPFERARLYELHGDFALALADLDRVAKLNPGDQRAVALRARILRLMGKPKEAKALQQAFLESHPQQYQVRFEYCRTLVDLGETEVATKELDALISTAEHPSPDVVAMRLEITEAIQENGPALALAWLNEFLAKHSLPVFQDAALRLEIHLGKTADALRRLDELVSTAPRPEALLLRKAELLQSTGQTNAAAAAARQAQQAISRLPDAVRNSRASQKLLEKIELLLPSTATP